MQWGSTGLSNHCDRDIRIEEGLPGGNLTNRFLGRFFYNLFRSPSLDSEEVRIQWDLVL